MTSANFNVDVSQQSPDYASPHALDVLNGMRPIPFFPNAKMEPVGPAGSINASVVDMSKYAAFQLGDGTVSSVGVTESTRLVSKEMLDTMHARQILIGGPAATSGQPDVQASGQQTQTTSPSSGAPLATNLGYGLGWLTEDYHGYKLVAHNGAIDGFYCYVTLVPSAGDGVVVLTDASVFNGNALFVEAARLHLVNWLLGMPSEPNLTDTINKESGFDLAQFKAQLQAARTYKADPAALAALAGDYPGVLGKLTVTAREGKLYAKFESQPITVELVPFEPGGFLVNAFPVPGSVSVITFKTDPNGTITIYQSGVQIAQRLGKGVQAAEYKDPKGRFTVTIPQGLAVKQEGDLVLLQSANPPGVFILTAADAGANSLQDNVTRFLKTLDPTFNLQPASVQALPPLGGVTWTQYLYQLEGDQVVAVVAAQQNGTTYLILGQAKSADLQALSPTFQSLLLSFKIGQGSAGQGQTPTPVASPIPSPGMPRTGTGENGEAPVVADLVALAALILLAGLAIRMVSITHDINH
jgi:hypothetical protein